MIEEKFASHFNDDEILKLEIMPQISRWKEVLKFNKNEIEFLRMVLFSNLMEKMNTNVKQSQYFIEKLNKINSENETYINTLFHFQNKMKGLRECDDVACENTYLNNYLLLKDVLQKHQEEFRAIKTLVYTYFFEGKKS